MEMYCDRNNFSPHCVLKKLLIMVSGYDYGCFPFKEMTCYHPLVVLGVFLVR